MAAEFDMEGVQASMDPTALAAVTKQASNEQAMGVLDREVKGLLEEVTRVEEVASQISGVAKQTNFLALNARIEAARAVGIESILVEDDHRPALRQLERLLGFPDPR